MGEWEPGFCHSGVCGEERHYSLLDLLSFILAGVPLSPPSPTSPLKSKDLEEGVQTERGGAGSQGWG